MSEYSGEAVSFRQGLFLNSNLLFDHKQKKKFFCCLTFRRRIKSCLPFAGIIRRLPYSTRFLDKG